MNSHSSASFAVRAWDLDARFANKEIHAGRCVNQETVGHIPSQAGRGAVSCTSSMNALLNRRHFGTKITAEMLCPARKYWPLECPACEYRAVRCARDHLFFFTDRCPPPVSCPILSLPIDSSHTQRGETCCDGPRGVDEICARCCRFRDIIHGWLANIEFVGSLDD